MFWFPLSHLNLFLHTLDSVRFYHWLTIPSSFTTLQNQPSSALSFSLSSSSFGYGEKQKKDSKVSSSLHRLELARMPQVKNKIVFPIIESEKFLSLGLITYIIHRCLWQFFLRKRNLVPSFFFKPSKEFSRYPSSHRVAKHIASEEKISYVWVTYICWRSVFFLVGFYHFLVHTHIFNLCPIMTLEKKEIPRKNPLNFKTKSPPRLFQFFVIVFLFFLNAKWNSALCYYTYIITTYYPTCVEIKKKR